MPQYLYRCPWGHEEAIRRSVEERDDHVSCLRCSLPAAMDRVITSPILHGETVPGGLGGSGDGYFVDNKTGQRSVPKKESREV